MVAFNTSEADILTRAIDPHAGDMPPDVAHVFSRIDFAPEDHAAMQELLAKAKSGSISAEDESLLRRYELINDLLALLRVKAIGSVGKKAGNGSS